MVEGPTQKCILVLPSFVVSSDGVGNYTRLSSLLFLEKGPIPYLPEGNEEYLGEIR